MASLLPSPLTSLLSFSPLFVSTLESVPLSWFPFNLLYPLIPFCYLPAYITPLFPMLSFNLTYIPFFPLSLSCVLLLIHLPFLGFALFFFILIFFSLPAYITPLFSMLSFPFYLPSLPPSLPFFLVSSL